MKCRRALLLLAALLVAAQLGGSDAAKKAVKEPEPEADEAGEADFWGVEVAANKKLKVPLKDEDDESIRLSQVR